MTDQKDDEKKTLQLSKTSKLSLNRSLESNRVKNVATSGGRTVSVQVQVRRNRSAVRDAVRTGQPQASGPIIERKSSAEQRAEDTSIDTRHLTDEERDLRLKVLQRAHQERDQEEQRRQQEADASTAVTEAPETPTETMPVAEAVDVPAAEAEMQAPVAPPVVKKRPMSTLEADMQTRASLRPAKRQLREITLPSDITAAKARAEKAAAVAAKNAEPEETPEEKAARLLLEAERGTGRKDHEIKRKKALFEEDFDTEIAGKAGVAGERHSKSASKKRRTTRNETADTFKGGRFQGISAHDILEDAGYEGDDLSYLLDDDDEFEDYSDEVEVKDAEEDVVAVARANEEAEKAGLVRSINTSQRLIVAAADPEKLKKFLRSEAPVGNSRRRQQNEAALVKQPDPDAQRQVGTPKKKKSRYAKAAAQVEIIKRDVVIPETIIISELANRMAVRSVDVIKSLMKMGMMVTQNQSIDADTAELIVSEYGHTPVRVSDADVEKLLVTQVADKEESLLPRAPVVTVMGHVDHGKTSLLDALRKANVVAGEAGGITQHIGAYQVEVGHGKTITFLDTPGHEAFTSMRARGANATDIVVLVVAADDGIKEQTVEAIRHAKAAQVPIIVAVNKIDKPDADPQRVRTELMSHELVPEEYGGDIMCVDVSAKAKINLEGLLEGILLQAEVLDLKANPNRTAMGMVIESRMEKGRGAVSSVLVQNGTLRVGDIMVAGHVFGRVRALINDKGENLQSAGPAVPVEVLGLPETTTAGDGFSIAENDKVAREVTEYRQQKLRDAKNAPRKMSLEDLFSGGQAKVKELPVIIKADVHGSAEAIVHSLEKIESSEVKVKVLHSAVGAITESDIALASASDAIVLGFNVRANGAAKTEAEKQGIEVKYYSIIYQLIDDVKAALSGLLSPEFKEDFLGYAEIRQVFNMSKFGKVAGCMVTSGVIKRGCKVRLLRDNVVIHEGSLKTLKRFKEDVREVREGFECGAAFENYEDIRDGDQIECFELTRVERTLEG